MVRMEILKEAPRFSAENLRKHDSLEDSLLSLLYREVDPETGKGLPMPQIWAELKFVMVTGAGSPASALAATLFCLVRNTQCYNTLVKEIRTTFSDTSEIHSGSKMSSCHYLQACIAECLRMCSLTGAVFWRRVEEDGIMIDGEHVSPRLRCGDWNLCHPPWRDNISRSYEIQA